MMNSGIKKNAEHSVGIMTTQAVGDPPFHNRGFYSRLCVLGKQSGLKVFVFTPCDVDWSLKKVTGYAYDADLKRWAPRSFPLPAIVYDRCFFTARHQYTEYRTALLRLKEHSSVRLLGFGLKDKWTVQQLLQQDGRFSIYLPQTERLLSMRTLLDWLQQRRKVILKPQSGSQGRGVLLVKRIVVPQAAGTVNAAGAEFAVRGRDRQNRGFARTFADAAELLSWLRRFIGRRGYLLQQYLPLHTKHGDAYDIRALVQKNGEGLWQLTGMAVRRGQDGSLTSNLHGGGAVEPARTFLAREFGNEDAAEILSKLTHLSTELPNILESCHGRLVELGIDYGIDKYGNIWIIEANSKPGRSIFTHLQDDQAKIAALANPLRYARFMLRQHDHRLTEKRQRKHR